MKTTAKVRIILNITDWPTVKLCSVSKGKCLNIKLCCPIKNLLFVYKADMDNSMVIKKELAGFIFKVKVIKILTKVIEVKEYKIKTFQISLMVLILK